MEERDSCHAFKFAAATTAVDVLSFVKTLHRIVCASCTV